MRVFNKEKTREIFYYDENLGYVVQDKIVTRTIPYKAKVEGVGHYEYKHYPNGGRERKWVWDIEPIEAVQEHDEYEEILVYIPYNAEQLQEKRVVEIKDRLSQLSEDFVQSWAGAQIADIELRKREFADLHNELRGLLGKAPRVYY
jgi:hypothetical protein